MKLIVILVVGVFGILLAAQIESRFGARMRAWYDKRERWAFPLAFAVFLGLAGVVPAFVDVAKVELGVLVGIYALMAMGLNIVTGLAGLLDLGYVAFFAIGAYTVAIFTNAGPLQLPWELSFWMILPLGMLIALAAGVLLGAPALRLRGDYLAIVTLGFGEIVRILAENLEPVTRGAKGITGIPAPSLFGKSFGVDPLPYYIVIVVFIGIFVLAIRRLNHSRVGRAWAAIREDEVAAEAMGVPTLKYKLWAFAIGASSATVGGMVYGARFAFVSPESFQLIISIFILSAVVLGGLGSTAGALTGAAVIIVVPELLRALPGQLQRFGLEALGERIFDARFGVFGLALVLMMIFRPQGLVPSRRRAAELKGGAAEEHGPLGAGLPVEAEVASGSPDPEERSGDAAP